MAKIVDAYKVPPSDVMQLIGKIVASGGPTSLTIGPIPTTFENLRLILCGRCNGGTFNRSSVIVRMNGDSGANKYGDQQYGASFQGVAGHQGNNFAYSGEMPNGSGVANYSSQYIYDIPNYKRTTFNKGYLNTTGFGNGVPDWYYIWYSSVYKSKTAVDSVTVLTQSGTFADGTTLWAYGF